MAELVALSEEERELALQRFRLLRPHLEFGRALRGVAAEAGIPLRTAQRWVARYRRLGLTALARSPRADAGLRKAVSPELHKAIEGLALQRPALPVAAIYRQVSRLSEAQGTRAPSYATVRRIVRSLPEDLRTLAHEGPKAYGDKYELVHRREASGPNAVWQCDHTPLDILLARPGTKAAKPWLTAVIDDYSRAVPGYFLSFDAPSALNTSLALRLAIWRKEDPRWIVCGIPDVLYTDSGSDFKSRHLQQVSADLEIQLINSIPGKPRGRGRIERFFSTVNEMFLCELEGYAPPGCSPRGRPTLTLPELEARFREFLLGDYHLRKSSETQTPPLERWGAHGFLPRMPEALEQLDLLLIRVARARQVRRDGIHFQNFRYVSTTLAAYVGESVTLRYDPRDMAEIRVFHEEKFLCQAVCPELAGTTVSIREIRRARNQRRRELRSLQRDRQQAVETLLQMRRGGPSEKQEDDGGSKDDPQKRPGRTLKRYRNE